jgi:alkylation response protein AidB-like acyl-CoA dehydrogenase
MDFTFTDDQVAFRDSMSRFLMNEAAPEMLREIWETDDGRSPDLRARIAEQGLLGLSVPEAEGGMGMGDVDWALMTQELGYYAIPDSLADTAYLASGMLAGLPSDNPVRALWMPRIADGTCRIAVGHPVNPWVADAEMADLLLLPNPVADGMELHAVPRAAVSVSACPSIDASRRLALVDWTPAPHTCVAKAAAGQSLWDEALDRGTLNVSGQLIGLAQRMLDLSVDYAAQRKQFGKPIGAFQAIKHHLADVVTKIEFAKPVLYRAVYALAHGEPHRGLLASHAKLVAADAAWTAARKGIQVHGAMGYTWEVDLQMFMKRAWVLDAAWGDRGYHKARLAAALLSPTAPLATASTLTSLPDPE